MYTTPPPYSKLGDNQTNLPPPPNQNNAPYHNEYYGKRSKGSCCCRVMCCCCLFLFLLIIILAVAALYLYSVYSPKMPTYNIESFNLKEFTAQPDMSLVTEVDASIRSLNPNNAIGFVYKPGSSVDVIYMEKTICSGELPSFRQDPRNITIMNLELKGKSQFGPGQLQTLQANTNSGRIPLLVLVKAPIRIEVGNLFLMRDIWVYVKCSLVVDSLDPTKTTRILESDYKFSFSFV